MIAAASPVAVSPLLAEGWVSEEPCIYDLYGLAVCSDVRLPCPMLDTAPADGIAWEIRLAGGNPPRLAPDAALVSHLTCDLPCHVGRAYGWVRRGPSGSVFWWERAATCVVPDSSDRVDVYPSSDCTARALSLMLVGQVAGLLMARRGISCLHASAVVIDGRAAAFLGPPGFGKSTLAAGFVRQGAQLLTDDVLPLARVVDDVLGRPSLPLLKMWHDTAEHAFGLRHEAAARTDGVMDKALLTDPVRLRFAAAPAPLRAIYVLDRFDAATRGCADVQSEALPPLEALRALIAQIYRGDLLTPAEMARLLPTLAQLASVAPVRRLSYPTGYANQDAVRARIMADLAKS